jgi:hypothetical protein
MDDESHQAMGREVNKIKIRNLHSQLIVSVISTDQSANKRTVLTEIRVIILAIDEARKSKVHHGFERRARCDGERQFNTLPTVPNRRRSTDK